MAFLWLNQGQPQDRGRLAGLLWPESSEQKARHSLSQAVHDLRKALEPGEDRKGEFFLITQTSVRFNPDAECWVDVAAFEGMLKRAEGQAGGLPALQEAIGLYRGTFLAECYDNWCLEEQDYLRGRYQKALKQMVDGETKAQEYENAIDHAKTLLALNDLQEEVHRQLMYLYHITGFRNAAIQQFKECARILREELDVEPEPVTLALYEEVKSGAPEQAAAIPTLLDDLPQETGAESRLDRSIAVLPFKDLSLSGEHEYFSDGLTVEINHALTKVSQLRVISSTSAFAFKERHEPLNEIGKRLNVSTVLEGSVRKEGKRVRITAQLTNVADNAYLWSETFDRELEDVFAVQDSITYAFVSALKVKLLGDEQGHLVRPATASQDAYQLYLKGRYAWNQRTVDSLHEAIGHFEAATARDGAFALAYAGLADAYNALHYYRPLPYVEGLAKAEAAADQAIALDPNLAEAYASLGLVKDYGWEWEDAERAYLRALTLNPGLSTARHWYALFSMNMGRLEEALIEMRWAHELDPLALVNNRDLGLVYFYARRYEAAEEQFELTRQMNPSFFFVHLYLGLVLVQCGRFEEAEAAIRQDTVLKDNDAWANVLLAYVRAKAGDAKAAQLALSAFPREGDPSAVPPYFAAMLAFSLDETDQGFRWLNQALEQKDFWLSRLMIDPHFDGARGDPRFQHILDQIGLKR